MDDEKRLAAIDCGVPEGSGFVRMVIRDPHGKNAQVRIGHGGGVLDGTPISRNTFRTRVWLPAIRASGVDFDVRVHDLRHAHASWLLAGGSDLRSVMDRMGHAQITTTQKYLHALPDADAKNLDALNRIRRREPQPADGATSSEEDHA